MQIDAPARDGEANAALLDYISSVSSSSFVKKLLNSVDKLVLFMLKLALLIRTSVCLLINFDGGS